MCKRLKRHCSASNLSLKAATSTSHDDINASTESAATKRLCLTSATLARGKALTRSVLRKRSKTPSSTAAPATPSLASQQPPAAPALAPSSVDFGATSKTKDEPLSAGVLDLIVSVLGEFKTAHPVDVIKEEELRAFVKHVMVQSRLGSAGLLYALIYIKRASCSCEHQRHPGSTGGDEDTADAPAAGSRPSRSTPCCCPWLLSPRPADGSPELPDLQKSVNQLALSEVSRSVRGIPLPRLDDAHLLGGASPSCTEESLDLRCLFLTAIILAHKYIYDKTYRLETWLRMATLPAQDHGSALAAHSIVRLERGLLRRFDYQCVVSPQELLRIGSVMKAVRTCLVAAHQKVFMGKSVKTEDSIADRSLRRLPSKTYSIAHGLIIAWLRSPDPTPSKGDNAIRRPTPTSTLYASEEPYRAGTPHHFFAPLQIEQVTVVPAAADKLMPAPYEEVTPELVSAGTVSVTPSTSSIASPLSATGYNHSLGYPDTSYASPAELTSRASQKQTTLLPEPAYLNDSKRVALRDRARRDMLEAAMKADGCGCDPSHLQVPF